MSRPQNSRQNPSRWQATGVLVAAMSGQGDQRFCGSCGNALDAQAGLREERKVITVLFCDLVGYTARADGSDPEDVEALVRPYHECVRTELTRYGATVEKFIGDAVMAVFGAPAAHEDDGEQAEPVQAPCICCMARTMAASTVCS